MKNEEMKTSKETVTKNPTDSPEETRVFKFEIKKFHFLIYKKFFIYFLKPKITKTFLRGFLS